MGTDLFKNINKSIKETEKKNEVIIYNSKFDYEKFEISDLKGELIESEKKIFINMERVGKATFEIAEELYSVNKKLANYNGGTYMAWCEAVGINKDKSSVLLKRYNLFLETDRKEIMKLPIPVLKDLTSKKNNLTNDEMLTVIESEKPSLKLKEIKKQYSQVANTESCEIEDAEIVTEKTKNTELPPINKKDLLTKKEKLFKDNEKINKEIEEFNKKIKEKMEAVEKNLDEMCDIDDFITRLENAEK
ncbi:MAG: hypothetical protein WBG30_08920 [Psychrilyobacter sp.]|uniref:hypothetical protein n=1 Tax=Psychrilyobacter sp. TaxID=2586924 RepID=UPI003C74B1AD